MTDIDPALMKQVFDIPERQRKPNVHHHSKLDNFWRRFEIAKRVLGHGRNVEQGG